MNLNWLFLSCFFCPVVALNKYALLRLKQVLSSSFKTSEPIMLLFRENRNVVLSQLLPKMTTSNNDATLFSVLRNWSVIVTNNDYKRINFNVDVLKMRQVLVFLDVARLEGNILSGEIASWKENVQWYGGAKFLIVIKSQNETKAQKIFEEMWKQFKSVNVAVMAIIPDSVKFLTWYPYQSHCQVKVETIPFEKQQNVFPVKIQKNLNGCKVIASTAVTIPYVYPTENNDTNFTEGIEIRIYETIGKKLNFTTGFLSIEPAQSPYRTFDDDGNPTGLMGQLYRHESDMAFFGVRLSLERWILADSLFSYYGDDMGWVAPPTEKVPEWRNMFFIFTIEFWGLLVITILISAVAVYFIMKEQRSFVTAFLLVWASAFCNSIPVKMTELVFRLFYVCYVVCMLIISTAYQSAIIRFSTHALSMPPYDTPYDASKAGLTVILFPSFRPETNLTDHEQWNVILKKVIWNDNYMISMRKTASERTFYFGLARLTARSVINKYFITRAGRSVVRIMKNRIKEYNPVIYVSKDHPLKKILNQNLHQIVESGLILYWLRTLDSKSISNRAETSEVYDWEDVEDNPVVTLKKVSGAFLLWIIFLIPAVIAFIIERLYYNPTISQRLK